MPKPTGSVLLLHATLAVLAAVACGTLTAEQRAAMARVVILATDPAPDCQNLGVISGSSDTDGPRSVRAKTVLVGGNTLRAAPSREPMAFYCPPPHDAGPTMVPIVNSRRQDATPPPD